MSETDKALFLELLLKYKIRMCHKIRDAEVELDGLIEHEESGEYLTFEEISRLKSLDINLSELKSVLTKLDLIEKFMKKDLQS